MVNQQEQLVTVIIPVYNAGGYLKQSVESILYQTYKNLQIIIADDGSTDNCLDFLNDINDPRIALFHQVNSGKSVALNHALKIAKGKYYAIQDADDLSAPRRIEALVAYMEKFPHLGAVFSGYDLIFNAERFAPICREKNANTCQELVEKFNMPSHDPTGFYRMKMVQDMQYDPELRIGQGYDYILRVGEKHPIHVVAECLYSYRISFGSTIRKDSAKRARMVEMVWKKACKRRKMDYEQWLIVNSKCVDSLRRGVGLYGVLSHCMESVVCLKVAKKKCEAFKTGVRCCRLFPLNLRYYKPLLYFLTPINLIFFYRNYKMKNLRLVCKHKIEK